MVAAQGGDPDYIHHPERFTPAPYNKEVCAPTDGYIASVNTEAYGIASLLLGAGRNRKEDRIDYAAGIELLRKTGDPVKKGEPIAILYASDASRFPAAENTLLGATVIGEKAPEKRPLLLFEVR